jgi:hypothetical protein
MKPAPTSPLARHARMIDALCADIGDRDATAFPRVDAMRSILNHPRDAGSANNRPADIR